MPSKQKLRKRRHNQKHQTPYQRSQRAPPPKHDEKEEQHVEPGGGQVATVQKLGCLTASLQQVRPDAEHQKDADRPEVSTLQKDVDCAPHKRQALDAAADSFLDETFETLGANEQQPAPSLNDCTSGQEQGRAPPPPAAPQKAPSPQQLETRVESLVDDTQEQQSAPPINQLESKANESIFAPRENEMLSSRGDDEETHFDTSETSAPDAGTAGDAKDWTIPQAALEDDTRTTSHEDTRPPVGSQEVRTGVGLTALNMKHRMLRAWLHLGKMKLLQQGGRLSPVEQQRPQDPKADCMSAELQEKCTNASATSDNCWIVRDVSPRGDTVQTIPTPQEEDTASALPNIDAREDVDDDDVASVEAETTSAPQELEGTAWEEQDVAAATAANPGNEMNEMAQGDDVITFALSPVENDTYAEENIAALQAHWIAEALLEDDTSARLEIEMDVAPLGEKTTAEHFFGLHAECEGIASASTRAALERDTTSESQTVHSHGTLKAEPKLDDTSRTAPLEGIAACGEEETYFESQTSDTKPVEEEMPLQEAHGDDAGAQKVQTVESQRDHPDPAWTGAALPADKRAEERTELDRASPEFRTNLVSRQVQEIRLEDTTSHEGDPSGGTPGEQTLEPQVTHGGDGSAPDRTEEGTGQASPNEALEEEKNTARPRENAAATSESQQRETSAEREESAAATVEPVALVTTALVSDKAPPPPNECGRTAAPGVVKKVKFYLDPDTRAPSDHTSCSEDAGPSAAVVAAAQKDETGPVGPRHEMTFVLQEDETPSPLPLEMEMQSESAPPEDDTPTSALQDETIVQPREEAAPEEVRNEPQEDGHQDEEEVTFTPDEYRSLLN
ncbi:uncharacterized protein LOC119118300 [Syngnathus acus]|uniref:uncharacterized protein LOC119118300 n=1 Tax=Syngnathus acus TaxID=161584 RepID=UPI001885DE23|nr:uncharacterized protein LOC119118300 [Syngnathus acus]